MRAALVALVALAAVAAALPAFPVVDPNAEGEHYAVLVAGSNTWGNYRHQADVCHAYQILVKNGYKKENIIVMMYDDIAENPENPDKGTIINQPNGPNVYQGIKIDYKGDQVTPDNFLKVLKGDSSASGPVLKSTSKDNVFINFVDHGGPGIIAFPSDMLSSTDLLAALNYMHTNNMYKDLVFYLEACESGSMFQSLPSGISVFATTAADATHSSYACYFDTKLNTYLGDVYSVNWMQNSDLGKLATETLKEQYDVVKAETNTSTVCEFGDMSMGSLKLNEFQGGSRFMRTLGLAFGDRREGAAPAAPHPAADAVDSREVDLAILRNRLRAAPRGSEEARALEEQYAALLNQREAVYRQFHRIVTRAAKGDAAAARRHLETQVSLRDYRCVEQATKAFHDRCLNLGQNSWALKHTMAFASLCAEGADAADLVAAVHAECPMTVKMVPQLRLAVN